MSVAVASINPALSSGAQTESPLRILLVDDDEADRMILTRALLRSGLQVELTEAEDGASALELLKAKRFDCALLDYRLPDMSGLDLIKEIAGPEGSPIATILVTGEGGEAVATEALKSGAQDYLSKSDIAPQPMRRAINTAMEKVQLMCSLELQRLELERSNQELEQYAYVTSHDLQEPLRIIVSFLQLLEKRYGGQLDEKADEYIRYAVDGGQRMQQMISSLLELSRIGRADRKYERVDVEEVLNEVLGNLKIAIEEAGVVITHDLLPEISCNRPRIAQLLQNLIGNAIKYRNTDNPRIHISAKPLPINAMERLTYATTVRNQTIWRFCVTDNGIGMDQKYHDRAFVIFQRLHARDEYSGTGIGLSLCKKIVERHNGRIWFKSKPGVGTKFYFTLPSRR